MCGKVRGCKLGSVWIAILRDVCDMFDLDVSLKCSRVVICAVTVHLKF